MRARAAVVACVVLAGCAGRSKLEVGGSGGSAGRGGSAGTGGSAGEPACAADVSSDPAHCGRCFHSCEGGDCAAGKCRPVTLAAGLARPPTALALGAEHVLWASPVSRASKDFGNFRSVIHDTLGDVWSMAVDDAQVFWINVSGGLQFAELEGAGFGALGVSGHRVALDDHYVYFTTAESVERVEKGLVERQVLAPMPGDALGVDDQLVYFTAPGGGLFRVPKDGGEAEALTKDSRATYIAAWNGTVFVSEQATPSGLFHVTGPGLRTLVAPVEEPYGVAVDGLGVFWVDWLDGSIWMRSHDAGAVPTTLASDQPFPRDIAVDERAVYWTNDDVERSVMKVAKP